MVSLGFHLRQSETEGIRSDLHNARKDSKEGEGQLHRDCGRFIGYVRLRGCLFLLAADRRGA